MSAAADLGKQTAGRILLQVEAHGEAWYVNPADAKRYYLGRPIEALNLMKKIGIGISEKNIEKLPIGLLVSAEKDSDGDGLSDDLEAALGTDPQNNDTDKDGHSDKTEIINNFDPRNNSKLPIDYSFCKLQSGKIFIQVSRSGQAWYINPADCKRYYLGSPLRTLMIMKKLGLGVTNANLNQITPGYLNDLNQINYEPLQPDNPLDGVDTVGSNVLSGAAEAIRKNNFSEAASYFIPEKQKLLEYTMNFLDDAGRLSLGNLLSGLTLASSDTNEKIYSTQVYFSLGGYKVPVSFHLKKQPDGRWLLANL